MTDTSRTIAFRGSGTPAHFYALAAAAMAVLAAAIAWPLEAGDVVLKSVFYGAAALFAYCAALALRRALTAPAWSVTLSPQGIRDPRISAELIPWRAIRDISRWSYGGTTTMVLDVDPAVERILKLTMLARMTRAPNRWFGADGLCVGAQGLNTDYDTLFNSSLAYWQAAAANRGHS